MTVMFAPVGSELTWLNGTAVELVVEPTWKRDGGTPTAVAEEFGAEVETCVYDSKLANQIMMSFPSAVDVSAFELTYCYAGCRRSGRCCTTIISRPGRCASARSN